MHDWIFWATYIRIPPHACWISGNGMPAAAKSGQIPRFIYVPHIFIFLIFHHYWTYHFFRTEIPQTITLSLLKPTTQNISNFSLKIHSIIFFKLYIYIIHIKKWLNQFLNLIISKFNLILKNINKYIIFLNYK